MEGRKKGRKKRRKIKKGKKERKSFIEFMAGYVMFFIPLIMADSFSTVNSEPVPIPVATPSISAARLLGLQVQIPPGASMPVFRECCVCCQVKVYMTSW